MIRLFTAIELILRFLWQVLVSGVSTARIILQPAIAGTPVLASYTYHDLDERGAALLGCMITLTPGTTTLDIDPDRRMLLLHILDARDPAGAAATIGREFERPLRRLFPAAARIAQ